MTTVKLVAILLLLSGEPMSHPVWGAQRVSRAVEGAASDYDVPASLVLAVALHESGLNPRTVGAVGEVGPWQLHPQWHAKGLSELCGLDPSACAEHHAGRAARVLRTGFLECGTWQGALAYYNRGHGCDGRREYISRVMREWRYVDDLRGLGEEHERRGRK